MDNINNEDIICSDKYLSLESESEHITYIKTDLLHNDLKNMIWRNNYHEQRPSKIWITGHSDYSIQYNIFNKYKNNCEYWFTSNKNIEETNIFAIPIGITNFTNETELHKIYGNTEIMIEIMKEPRVIKNLIYLNFNITTYREERQRCYNFFYNKSYVTVGQIKNTLDGRKEFLRNLRNHKFVLCPRGNGIDTHRLWETLYMGSIPIVKRCCAMNEFIDLPILFIDDWLDVANEEYLEMKYKDIVSSSWNLEKLKFSYWKNKILTFANC